MDFVIESFRADWEAFLRFAPRLFYALVVFAIFTTIGKYAGRMVAGLLQHTAQFRANLAFLQRVTHWAFSVLGIFIALGIMGFEGVAASMLATGGVVAIVLGFAFREIGENFLAGFFLTFSRPFELDDLIKTGDLTGTVRSIELRNVHIRTFDACDVFVPSAQIFREPLYNYTRDGVRRPSFTVGVAYHDDPAHIIKLLVEATTGVTDVLKDPHPFVTVKEFGAQHIEYEVFFYLDVNKTERGYVALRNDVKIRCWRALRDANMTFSTDVSAGLDIKSVPSLAIELTNPSPPAS